MMKVNGNLQTFAWSSAYWSSLTSYNDNAVLLGLDTTEFKSSFYGNLPFTHVRVGFAGSRSNNLINWASFAYSANSLYACIADGVYRPVPLDRAAWKEVVGSGSLQINCNQSGFNSASGGGDLKIRLGILGNNENECSSPDSRIGIGGQGTYCGCDNTNSCGNEAMCSGDLGDVHYKAYGFIMVR